MTRVLVCGGRKFRDTALLIGTLDSYHHLYTFTLLIEGGALGADRLAREWAKLRGVPIKTYEADWDTYGDAAGRIRNRLMLVDGKPDLVIAFKGGPGTNNMCLQSMKRMVEVIRV